VSERPQRFEFSAVGDPTRWDVEQPLVVPSNHPLASQPGTIVDGTLGTYEGPRYIEQGPGTCDAPRMVPGRPPDRRGQRMQPMAGQRQKLIGAQLETVAFANRRKKNRKRRELAKASRKRNR
jgi:hypothetical protein